MSAVAAQPIINAEAVIISAVREYGTEYEAPDLVSVISKRTGLPERVVRGVIWDLIAQGRLELTSARKIAAF